MEFVQTSTPDLGVYINDNYITIARSATAIQVDLAAGATFDTAPSLAGVGLAYDISGDPQFISGDPSGLGSFAITTLTPTEAIALEVIEPTYSLTPVVGSARVLITDTMVANNPALEGRGRITYSLLIDGAWVVLGTVSRGNSLEINGCDYDFGTFDLRAVYTVHESPNGCGCGAGDEEPENIFIAEYTDTITFAEFRPELSLVFENSLSCAGDCCSSTIGYPVTVYPTFDTNQTTGESTLTYTLYDFEGAEVGSPTVITIDNTDPGAVDAFFTFTPTNRGNYRVVATLDNGYAVCTREIIITSCDYILLTEVLGGCNQYKLQNCSLTVNHTYTMFDTESNVVGTANLPLNAGTSVTITLPDDGVYYITIYNEDDSIKSNYVMIGYCNILKCLTDNFNGILCAPCSCENACEKRYNMNRILPTAYLFMGYVHKEYTLNNVYSLIDAAKITELQTISSVLEKLKAFCDTCGSDNSGCGC